VKFQLSLHSNYSVAQTLNKMYGKYPVAKKRSKHVSDMQNFLAK